MFTARITSTFTPPANQTCISGIFSNAVFMGHISEPIGGHLKFTARVTSKFTPQAIEHAFLESLQMQCSWVTSHGQYEDTFMFTARVTSKFSPPANQTCTSGIFSNAVFMGHISWPIGGHLHVYPPGN